MDINLYLYRNRYKYRSISLSLYIDIVYIYVIWKGERPAERSRSLRSLETESSRWRVDDSDDGDDSDDRDDGEGVGRSSTGEADM